MSVQFIENSKSKWSRST